MQNTRVKDLMEEHLITVSPEATLLEASKKMKEADCGCLPVGSGETPEGIITDRDIVVRAIAEGKNPAEATVRDYMTVNVKNCKADDTLSEAAEIMQENGISRIIVNDENGKMCGILSFGRMLRQNPDPEETSQVVACATGKAECGVSGNGRA
jgi:CBS domain-containing protein